jgi:hypothetical protein
MSKRLLVTAVAVSCLFAGRAFAQETSSRHEAIAKALGSYLAAEAAADQSADQGAPAKAVPRADKAEAAIIGVVTFVDGTDFLDDGTPFRIVALHPNRPVSQDAYVVCLGSSWNNTCGRLIEGRRVSFTSDILFVQDGDNAGLALFIVKKQQT